MAKFRAVQMILWLGLMTSCRDRVSVQADELDRGGDEMTIHLTSSAFALDEPIPERFTADGENVSPPLSWSNLPEGTVELALICDDPDAPRADPWVHWVIYGLAPGLAELPEAIPADPILANLHGAGQGNNDSGRIGYVGPAPPPRHGVHHYYFVLYALDSPLTLGPGATKAELLQAMEGHILARGSHMGTYSRE